MANKKPDTAKPAGLYTDFSLGSYAVIGDLYRRTLEALGLEVVERPLEEKDGAADGDGRLALHNTIGPRFRPVPGAFNVALPAHEWSRYPAAWAARLNEFDEVWTTTDHVRGLLIESGVTAPVLKLPPALDLDEPPRKSGYAAPGPFRIFSCGQAHFRKGFHLLIEGYLKAFPDAGEARLVIKTSSDCGWTAPREDITINCSEIERQEILAEYAKYDAYATASLGEGLGLPVAEAVLAGLPVAANFWGGHASVLREGGFFMIGHEEAPQPFCSDPSYYAPGQTCAYSSPESVAKTLREVQDAAPETREKTASAARESLLENYGSNAVLAALRKRLDMGN